jgi:hypothetical protein
LDDPDYIKVLKRRVECNIKIGTWSSLTQTQEGKVSTWDPCGECVMTGLLADLKHLLDLLPTTDPKRNEISRQMIKIEPLLAKAQKTETDEMLNKLKELGNNVLGALSALACFPYS